MNRTCSSRVAPGRELGRALGHLGFQPGSEAQVGQRHCGLAGERREQVAVGVVEPRTQELLRVTEQALYAGIAAARAGLRLVMVPERNAADVAEVPEEVARVLEIRPVRTVDEVLAAALAPKGPAA